MKAVTNPDLPVVISASTDIGYVIYLMSRTERYRNWSLARTAEMLLPALTRRQLRVYVDDAGNPLGFLAWAFVGETQLRRFEAGNVSLEPKEWSSGPHLVLMHIAAPFGGARAIVRDFKETIAKGQSDARRIRYGREDGIARAVYLRDTGRRTVTPEDERLTFDQLIEQTSGSCLPFGCFASAASDGKEAFAETGRRLCRSLDPKAGDRVLDARCGTGDLARAIAAHPKVTVDGVDRSAHRVLTAWEKSNGNAQVRFLFYDRKAPLPTKGLYDKLVLCDALPDEPERRAMLKALSAAASPNARLLLTDLIADDEESLSEQSSTALRSPVASQAAFSSSLADAGFDLEALEDWTDHQIRSDRWLLARLPLDHPRARCMPALTAALEERVDRARRGALKRIVVLAVRRKSVHLAPAPSVAGRKQTSLVMLSGGLDSVYTLWKLLTETDDAILAHHINFVNFERRYVVEAERCRRIVTYLKDHVRDFRYSETTLDRRSQQFAGYDMMACGYEAGLVANSYLLNQNSRVDRWTVGTCLEEGGWSARWDSVESCVKASAYPLPAPKFFSLPIVSKQEEIDAVPSELLRLTWACRRPKLTDAGYEPCGVCKTCRLFASTNHTIG